MQYKLEQARQLINSGSVEMYFKWSSLLFISRFEKSSKRHHCHQQQEECNLTTLTGKLKSDVLHLSQVLIKCFLSLRNTVLPILWPSCCSTSTGKSFKTAWVVKNKHIHTVTEIHEEPKIKWYLKTLFSSISTSTGWLNWTIFVEHYELLINKKFFQV